MRNLRNILRICLTISILLWTAGFIVGSRMSLLWSIAGMASYVAPVSAVLLVVMALTGTGESVQAARRKAGDTLKCVECGRPSVPGSKYCRYHLDIMKDEEQRSV